MSSRTVEITEAEAHSVANAMMSFAHWMKHGDHVHLSAQEAAGLAEQMGYIDSFLGKVKHAFKNNKPTRKADIYSIDGGKY